MSSIVEDDKIWEVFHRVIWLGVQLNGDMRAGEEAPFFGFAKESNLLSVEKRNQYENEMERLEEKLYHLLYKLNRIEIRESLEGLDHVDDLKALRHGYFKLEDVWDELKNEIIEYHKKQELIDEDLFLENYYSLDPPYVKIGGKIPDGIRRICHESRWCYVYGQYNATVVLSRSLIETILKDKLKIEKWEKVNIKKLIGNAEHKKIISENVAKKAQEIREFANNILHRRSVAEE